MSAKSRGHLPGGRLVVPGKRVKISAHTGKPILCAWDVCDTSGDDRIRITTKRPDGGATIFIFCNDRHRDLFHQRHSADLPPV